MQLRELGEFGLIDTIRARAATTAGVWRGIGDDAAEVEIPTGEHLLTSTDLLLEGVHFDFAWTAPFDLGAKAVAVNLSDIAAMGGTARFLYIGLACPAVTEVADLHAFVDGVLGEAGRYGVALVGGDTCRSPGPWIVSVTIEGSAPAGEAVGRDGARPGECLLVSGTLGDSALALALWQEGETPESYLAERHCRPTPRLALGRELARQRLATAMIDLSDGLVADLEHILQGSGVGAEVHGAALPLSPAFRTHLAIQPRRLELALGGGEDYELLCSVPAVRVAEALALGERLGVPLTPIGTVLPAAAGLRLRDPDGALRPLRVKGYDHFCRSAEKETR
jgi:thiamine-monophosphate kinase